MAEVLNIEFRGQGCVGRQWGRRCDGMVMGSWDEGACAVPGEGTLPASLRSGYHTYLHQPGLPNPWSIQPFCWELHRVPSTPP